MLNFGNKEFRNLQEQVGKNQEDIQELKAGIKVSYWLSTTAELETYKTEANIGMFIVVGSTTYELYLITKNSSETIIAKDMGAYPAAVKGETGDTGATGAAGRNPKIVVGNGPLPQDDDYEYRDIYIFKADYNTYKKGDLWQLNAYGNWQLMCNIVGPQGVPASEGDEVIANPEGETATEQLTTVSIDGVVYGVYGLTQDQQTFITNLAEYMSVDDDTGEIEVGGSFYVDGSIETDSNLRVGSTATFEGTTQLTGSVEDSNGESGEQGQVLTSTGQEEVTWQTPTKYYWHFVLINGDYCFKILTKSASPINTITKFFTYYAQMYTFVANSKVNSVVSAFFSYDEGTIFGWGDPITNIYLSGTTLTIGYISRQTSGSAPKWYQETLSNPSISDTVYEVIS